MIDRKLKQKHIESFLQSISDFEFGEKQKIGLEQHMTPPDVAAKLLHLIYLNEPVEEYVAADLGTGTGMLISGLLFIGVLHAVGVQIDQKYSKLAHGQLESRFDNGLYEIIQADMKQQRFRDKSVDLVVMNPPFGTKEAGIDMRFVEQAMRICRGNIYSMHKSTTREHIIKYCQERDYIVTVLMQVNFPLPKRFCKYHKKEVAFTQVDVLRISPTSK